LAAKEANMIGPCRLNHGGKTEGEVRARPSFSIVVYNIADDASIQAKARWWRWRREKTNNRQTSRATINSTASLSFPRSVWIIGNFRSALRRIAARYVILNSCAGSEALCPPSPQKPIVFYDIQCKFEKGYCAIILHLDLQRKKNYLYNGPWNRHLLATSINIYWCSNLLQRCVMYRHE